MSPTPTTHSRLLGPEAPSWAAWHPLSSSGLLAHPGGGALLPLDCGGREGREQAEALAVRCLFPGTVLDHLVGEETLADYLLYTLNKHQLLG